MSDHELVGREVQQRVTADRATRYQRLFEAEVAAAQRKRHHYWLAILTFKVTPPVEDDHLFDAETLRSGPDVGCYICERPWSPDINCRRCPGGPNR